MNDLIVSMIVDLVFRPPSNGSSTSIGSKARGQRLPLDHPTNTGGKDYGLAAVQTEHCEYGDQ